MNAVIKAERKTGWEDIRRDLQLAIFEGEGLAASTKRVYMSSVKSLFDFTGRLHPGQVTGAVIEEWYDTMVGGGLKPISAKNKVAGLKRFYKQYEKAPQNKIGGFVNPFEDLSPGLLEKLKRASSGKTKLAISPTEFRAFRQWLSEQTSLVDRSSYLFVSFLSSTGLRAAEFCGLRWEDIQQDPDDGSWYCWIIGKGRTEPEMQEIAVPEVVEMARALFREQHKREPLPGDRVFWTVPRYNRDSIRPMNPHALWYRIKAVGKKAMKSGVLQREFKWSPHLFRRTYATLLYKSGMGLKAIQKKTRHKSLDVLMKHYIFDDEPAAKYLKEAFA